MPFIRSTTPQFSRVSALHDGLWESLRYMMLTRSFINVQDQHVIEGTVSSTSQNGERLFHDLGPNVRDPNRLSILTPSNVCTAGHCTFLPIRLRAIGLFPEARPVRPFVLSPHSRSIHAVSTSTSSHLDSVSIQCGIFIVGVSTCF